MKPRPFFSKQLAVAITIACFSLTLVAWGFRQPGLADKQSGSDKFQLDTVPKNKDTRVKKARDLDEVLIELDNIDLKIEMEKVQKEINEAMKNLNTEKIKLDIEKAMKDVDFEKIQLEIQSSLAKIDWDKIKKDIEIKHEDMVEVEKEMKKVQEEMKELGPKLQKELAEMKKVDMVEIEKEMAKVREELKAIGPEIQKELTEAKAEIERVKKDLQEYKTFVDGLDKDGLISKKENYTIEHKDGKLIINGKTQPESVYGKYRSFLEKHKEFSIRKDQDDFDIDID